MGEQNTTKCWAFLWNSRRSEINKIWQLCHMREGRSENRKWDTEFSGQRYLSVIVIEYMEGRKQKMMVVGSPAFSGKHVTRG